MRFCRAASKSTRDNHEDPMWVAIGVEEYTYDSVELTGWHPSFILSHLITGLKRSLCLVMRGNTCSGVAKRTKMEGRRISGDDVKD